MDNKKILDTFESQIVSGMGMEPLDDIYQCSSIGNKRHSNLRFSNFTSDDIFQVFYNDHVLNEILKLTDDFYILSTIESFYLSHSLIHKDNYGEIKQIKLLYYIDVLDDIDKGPFWVVPGSQHIYDRYSTLIGTNIQCPPGINGKAGSGFIDNIEFFEERIPRHYILTNENKIIMFNPNVCHGSKGNLHNTDILRRALGMTIMCVDKNNKSLMRKIHALYNFYKIDHRICTRAYDHCIKHNKEKWLKHFYIPDESDNSQNGFSQSMDGTDSQAIDHANTFNLFEPYQSSLDNIIGDVHNIYNTGIDRLQHINKNDSDLKGMW